jgi:hypothetical protein
MAGWIFFFVPVVVRAAYSGFDSGLYRILDAKWHFSQEKCHLAPSSNDYI